MAKTGVVKKSFPYAEDGVNIEHLAVGRVLSFPDSQFDGLKDGGWIEESKKEPENGTSSERDTVTDPNSLDLRPATALDRKLATASDQDLKDIIARSGTPWTGNLVHAEMVAAAKLQMVREREGEAPVLGVDPNSGVTEQPLSAPGAPTPPSAAKAVEQQQAQQEAIQQNSQDPLDHDANGRKGGSVPSGENKATDQFGDPLGGKQSTGETKLDEMTVAELKDEALKRGVDLGDATRKADIIEKLKA